MTSNRTKYLCSSLSGLMAGGLAGVPGGIRTGRGTSVSRSAAGIRPVICRLAQLLASWAIFIALALLPQPAAAANNGDKIVNHATFTSVEFPAASASVTVTFATRTPSSAEFLKYAPGISGAANLPVATTYYNNGSTGSFSPLPPPKAVGTRIPLDLTSPLPLLPYKLFHDGEPVFIRVTDLDQNLDRSRAETIIVTLSDSKTGDTETLRLTESGPDTGIFIGYIQISSAASITKNGTLSVAEDSSINAAYIDIVDGSDSSADAALVDPFGIIFDTITGKPVDGAKVELLKADGTPATVLGDNGLATNNYPNSVISGGTAKDAEGSTYSFGPGGYRFPFVDPGDYILKIVQPDGYTLPSPAKAADIMARYGNTYTILNDGSFGLKFSVPTGPAIRVDIPLDPKIGTLWLSKSAGKSIVSAGEFLSYDIALENTDPVGTVFSAVVTDNLPPGFRFQKGSARLNNLPVTDPTVSADGSTLTFTVGTLGPKLTATLRYIAAVGVGAKAGMAVNTATAAATPPVTTNVTQAAVQVQEPFMQSRTLIMGRVIVGACSDNIEESKKGMEGVGIYLEDGTFVITDMRGMFHFEGVRPGTHVVQLDLDSIPEGYKIQPCEQNSRFAGRAYSQFADLQGGSMWRTDFYLERTALAHPATANSAEKSLSIGMSSEAEAATLRSAVEKKVEIKPPAIYKGEITLEMISGQSGEIIDYRLPLQAHTVPLKQLKLIVVLPEGATYQPGSSSFNGAHFPDPEVTPGGLAYPLEDATDKWLRELQFRAVINKERSAGELETKAVLKFDTSISSNIFTPEVTNILSLTKEELIVPLPLFVFRPHFPTFGDELSAADRPELDALVSKLADKIITRIDVTGHTDNVRIAPRSRGIHADNSALSLARARSVGRYLATALHLPPSALHLNGSGENEPLAANKSETGRALNRRVEVKISALQRVETTHLKIIKERSGVEKTETTGGAIKETAEELKPLTPLQPNVEAMVVQPASNFSVAAMATDNPPPVDAPLQGNLLKKSAAYVSAQNEERVELFSALSEGIVHYRIKLAGVKDPLKKVSATLVTPKSQLYVTGTSRLSGSPVADPETKEAVIAYNVATLLDDRKFDLRLQTLIDGDDQSEALSSSVTVVLADADGKPLRTYTATSELSDSMEEINRPDLPPTAAAENSAKSAGTEKEASENINEYVEKVTRKGDSGKTEAANSDAGLHVKESEGILSPVDGTIIASQINAVRIVLGSGLTPVLVLDGKEISADRIGFKLKDRESEKNLYTYIGVDFGDAGEHILRLKGVDTFGQARFDESAKVTRTGEITSIRFISAEDNVADGRTPVKVRVQLFDKDDKPVMANAELALKGGELRPLSATGNTGRDAGGGMVSIDGQGWIKFQPVTASGLYRLQLAYNKATIDIETYVKPVMRDWILVGLAEGTAGYRTATGHMENLKVAGENEHLYDKERLAFYAKGTIKGEWLLTMAYDSAKQSTGVAGNALFQNIDPNAYYTLYGDSTAQGYEAASQKKLFLKVERDQFYAMYGDFDTGLSVTELSRYSRRLNGIKTEFRSNNYELTVFGSETGQSFVKDELRGDGTSGLYRLSRTGLVLNSEKITIESRDRFHSETVTDTRQLGRFIDYSIDYDSGAIFFKGPVPSRDEQLNPVYIIVDYEIANAGKDALTYGGRAGTKLLNGNLKVGGSYIHEGHVSGANNLYGADAALTLGPGTKARAEIAATNSDTSIMKASGNAYLAEITHTDKALDGKAYYREQENGFGLGQQKGSEAGTRKFGAEGAYKLNNDIVLSSQAYRQYNLTGGTSRDFIESLGTYSDKQLSARAGLRYANDTLADDSNQTSVLGTAGVSWKTLKERLTLRADHDQALFSKDNNADFPTRTILEADYQATKQVMLFAQEELTYGAAANTSTTRVGVKATPWSGGTLASSVVNDIKENSERTFATVGLAQKWQLNPFWTVDGGLDHTRTMQKKTGYQLSAAVPPASGGDDFTAVSLGANYQQKKLTWTNRVEYRNSDSEDKWGILSGVINEQGLNWGWTSRLQLLHSQSIGGSSRTDADLRLGLAYRPPVTRWIVLDRLDLIASDDKSATTSSQGKRVINNLNANCKPDKKTQLSLQYGAKYVLEKLGDHDYSGFTDLIGVEGRYDLTKDWDISLRGSILHSWELNQYGYSIGPSIGYNIMENAWLSLGYNLHGFHDKDFSAANFTSQGPFVQFRFKFDQNSVKDGLKALNL